MNPVKRKLPYSPSPTPQAGGTPRVVPVKQEDGQGSGKKFKPGPGKLLSSSHGNFRDPRTAAAAMGMHLKNIGTMGWEAAYFHVQSEHPGHEPREVLGFLKNLERVQFNEVNQVFTYIPELTIPNLPALRTYIRTNTTPTQPIAVKDIRAALPPAQWGQMIEELERRGDVLVMKALSGSFKEAALPKLGKANILGLKINDLGTSGYQRLKSIWWDEVRERGRAGKRVDEEFIFAWDEIRIEETDDVVKLLERENLAASSNMPIPQKVTAAATGKKKPARRRPLKITNTHMKEQGIDFSKEYEKPS